MRLVVFGDSLPYGAWDTQGGWVDRLKREAHKRAVESGGEAKLQVVNLGIGSDTSTKILGRMRAEIEARKSASWPFVFIFAFGCNDERSDGGENETPIELFEENVREIINLAKNYTDKILFLGIAPIAQPTVKFKGNEYSDERIKAYDTRLKRVVEMAAVSYLPIRPAFEETGFDCLFSYDNIHPNDSGHGLIANLVRPKLEEFLAS